MHTRIICMCVHACIFNSSLCVTCTFVDVCICIQFKPTCLSMFQHTHACVPMCDFLHVLSWACCGNALWFALLKFSGGTCRRGGRPRFEQQVPETVWHFIFRTIPTMYACFLAARAITPHPHPHPHVRRRRHHQHHIHRLRSYSQYNHCSGITTASAVTVVVWIVDTDILNIVV